MHNLFEQYVVIQSSPDDGLLEKFLITRCFNFKKSYIHLHLVNHVPIKKVGNALFSDGMKTMWISLNVLVQNVCIRISDLVVPHLPIVLIFMWYFSLYFNSEPISLVSPEDIDFFNLGSSWNSPSSSCSVISGRITAYHKQRTNELSQIRDSVFSSSLQLVKYICIGIKRQVLRASYKNQSQSRRL